MADKKKSKKQQAKAEADSRKQFNEMKALREKSRNK